MYVLLYCRVSIELSDRFKLSDILTPSIPTSKNDQSMPGIQPSHVCIENDRLIISWYKIRWCAIIRACLVIKYLPYNSHAARVFNPWVYERVFKFQPWLMLRYQIFYWQFVYSFIINRNLFIKLLYSIILLGWFYSCTIKSHFPTVIGSCCSKSCSNASY